MVTPEDLDKLREDIRNQLIREVDIREELRLLREDVKRKRSIIKAWNNKGIYGTK